MNKNKRIDSRIRFDWIVLSEIVSYNLFLLLYFSVIVLCIWCSLFVLYPSLGMCDYCTHQVCIMRVFSSKVLKLIAFFLVLMHFAIMLSSFGFSLAWHICEICINCFTAVSKHTLHHKFFNGSLSFYWFEKDCCFKSLLLTLSQFHFWTERRIAPKAEDYLF